MPLVIIRTTIAAPIHAVWKALLEHAGSPLLGGRRPLELVVAEQREPHAVVFGIEARLVQQQRCGPLASLCLERELEAVDSKTTRLADRITFRAAGPFGWVAGFSTMRWRLGRAIRRQQSLIRQRAESMAGA